MPYHSFIMVCSNQWKFTEQAVLTLNESLSHCHKKNGVELIIINNGSTDETKKGIDTLKEQLKKEIEIIPVHLEKNMGYLIGTNIGFSMCRGKIITLLNNDLLFPKNWYDGIVSALENNPDIGAAAPFLSYASGIANVGIRLNSINEINDFSSKFILDNSAKIIDTDRIIGACISIKRELFSKVGGNDYWFGMGWFEDEDWSLRARIAGYRIVVVGASFVYHIGNASIGLYSDFVTAALKANGDKFSRKWNVVSGYNSKSVIEKTTYSRQKHYFPCSIADFIPHTVWKNDSGQNLLLAADWFNECSNWKNELKKAVSEINENAKLTIWAPNSYFPNDKVIDNVKEIFSETCGNINFDFDDVEPEKLLSYLNGFNEFLSVDNDFVNMYLEYLIKKSGLNLEIKII